jgi:hypothetical protein
MQNNTLSNYRVLFRMLKKKNMGTWQHLYIDNIKIVQYYIK